MEKMLIKYMEILFAFILALKRNKYLKVFFRIAFFISSPILFTSVRNVKAVNYC